MFAVVFLGGGSFGVTTFILTPLACGSVACAAVDDTRSVSSTRSGGSGAYPKLFVSLGKTYTSLGKKVFHLIKPNFFMGHNSSFGRTMVSTKKKRNRPHDNPRWWPPASQDNNKLQPLVFPYTSVQQDEELESQMSHSEEAATSRQTIVSRSEWPHVHHRFFNTFTFASLPYDFPVGVSHSIRPRGSPRNTASGSKQDRIVSKRNLAQCKGNPLISGIATVTHMASLLLTISRTNSLTPRYALARLKIITYALPRGPQW